MERSPLLGKNKRNNDNGREWWREITVEPMAVMYFAAWNVSTNLLTNLILEKSCITTTREVTSGGGVGGGGICDNEAEAELARASVSSWQRPVETFLSVMVSVYALPITDSFPKCRSLFIYVPILGQLMTDSSNLLNAYFWNWSAAKAAAFQSVICGLTGTRHVMTLLCYSYLSHRCRREHLTKRLCYFYCAMCLGFSAGGALSGYVKEYAGFCGGFAVCACMNFAGIVSIYKLVLLVEEEGKQSDGNIIKIWENSVFRSIWVIPASAFNVVVKHEDGRKKTLICMNLVAYTLLMCYAAGEDTVLYLYLRRNFNWDAVQYGFLSSFKMLMMLTGSLIFGNFLKHVLNFKDISVTIIGTALDSSASFLLIFATKTWQVYAISFLTFLHVPAFISIISSTNQLVRLEVSGKLNSLFGLMYGLTLVAYPIYNGIFSWTILTVPYAIFITDLVFLTPVLIIAIITYTLIGEMRDNFFLFP